MPINTKTTIKCLESSNIRLYRYHNRDGRKALLINKCSELALFSDKASYFFLRNALSESAGKSEQTAKRTCNEKIKIGFALSTPVLIKIAENKIKL